MDAPRIGTRPVEPALEAVIEELTPALVGDSPSYSFWLRQFDGSFIPMGRSKFCSQVRSRKIASGTEEFLHRALRNRVKILKTAGLQPGVYAGPKGRFLVPQFVPMVAPAEAADPPAEFQKLSEELLSIVNKPSEASRQQQLRARMIQIYQEVRGVEACRAVRYPWRLLGMKDNPRSSPNDEHSAMFKGPQGFIRTCQPYGLDLPDVVGFAHFHNLSVSVSPKWTWYRPTRSLLVEWRKA
jgi:hypothetical protein